MTQNGKLSMIIVLPDEIDGLAEVEKKLENLSLSYLRECGISIDINLSLPKFKIESTLHLKDTLSEVSTQ